MMFAVGCQKTPSVLDESIPSVNELRSLVDIDEVGLEWTPIDSQLIDGYEIYRANQGNQNLKKIATIKDRYSSHYLDKNLQPSTNYLYAIAAISQTSHSNLSPSISVTTKPKMQAVAFLQAINDLPRRIKIIWRPHVDVSVSSYVLEKKDISSTKWSYLAQIDGRLSAEYIDKNLGDNKIYEYRIFAKNKKGLLSLPSQMVSAKTKPLPLSITNIQTSTDVPKKIKITWDESRNSDKDYYIVYSSRTSSFLFTPLVKTKNTFYEDLVNSNGAKRYYKVTVVDTDKLESLKQDDSVMGRTLPAPNTPVILSVNKSQNQVVISWNKEEGVRYSVLKKVDGKIISYDNIQDGNFIDNDVVMGVKYRYNIIGIDKYGLKSDLSEDVDILIDEKLY